MRNAHFAGRVGDDAVWECTLRRALRLALGTHIWCEGENAHFAGRVGDDAVWEHTFRRALRLALGTHIS